MSDLASCVYMYIYIYIYILNLTELNHNISIPVCICLCVHSVTDDGATGSDQFVLLLCFRN